MKNEKPILFNAEMVRAILNGRKTQTRRLLKLPHGFWENNKNGDLVPIPINCPLGNIGDELWVRENHSFDEQMNSVKVSDMSFNEPIFYPATNQISAPGCAMISVGKTRPSIHMPRWASRIQLRITDISIERLNAITDKDALAEGIDQTNTSIGGYAKERFKRLWQSIYGEKSWADDPWVWVIEFERIEK